MKNKNHKFGFTLTEILIVTIIITVLVAMVAGIAGRIETQREETLLKESFTNINTALQHFADYGYKYPLASGLVPVKREFYRSLKFPIDCNDFPDENSGDILGVFRPTMEEVLGTIDITIYKTDQNGNITFLTVGSDTPDDAPYKEYAGSQALYYFLNQVPECQKILKRINQQMVTRKSEDEQLLYIKIDGIVQPLFRFIDPWGNAIKYDYYEEKVVYPAMNLSWAQKSVKSFPTLTSAGPDGEFGTGDEIKSRN